MSDISSLIVDDSSVMRPRRTPKWAWRRYDSSREQRRAGSGGDRCRSLWLHA